MASGPGGGGNGGLGRRWMMATWMFRGGYRRVGSAWCGLGSVSFSLEGKVEIAIYSCGSSCATLSCGIRYFCCCTYVLLRLCHVGSKSRLCQY
jgi:hypothetical protein